MPLRPAEGMLRAFEERRPDLRRFLVARTGSEADADDLLSEMWIKLRSSALVTPVSNAQGYLFRMANNLVLDRVREARRRARREKDWSDLRYGKDSAAEDVADDPTAEEMLIAREDAQRLAHAIQQLPAGAQRVLRMHKLEGLSHAEVALRLGISKSAVEKHIAVAMTHLRRLLED